MNSSKKENELAEPKTKTIRMPSPGAKFKLMDTRFEIIKVNGFKFTAVAVRNDA